MLSLELLLDNPVVDSYVQILQFPINNPEFIPSLIPLFIGLVVLELYFGRYTDEHLGWNSAVSNATLILTTGLTLLYELHSLNISSGPRFIVAYSILFLGLTILVLNFYHLWPAELAYNLSSASLTHTLVYITIAVVYEGLMPNMNTFLAVIGVFLTFFFAFMVLRHVENHGLVPRRLRRA